MRRINRIGRALLGAVLVALMLPLWGCVIRTRDYYYPRDGYYRDYDGPRYHSYSYYYYYRR